MYKCNSLMSKRRILTHDRVFTLNEEVAVELTISPVKKFIVDELVLIRVFTSESKFYSIRPIF